MKKKILVGLILSIFILTIFMSFNEVKAFEGDIDSHNYISFPISIYISNKKAETTIGLSSQASGYNMWYQKLDITDEQLNNMQEKYNETENYIQTARTEKTRKEEELESLRTEYQNLQNDASATEEQKTNALNAYNEAYEEYETFMNTATAQIEEKKNQYYASVPNYTDAWQEISNNKDNVKLDFSNYSGKINFILWAKISNGTDTYYNFKAYSTEIKSTTSTTVEDNESISGVKIELKKNGDTNAIMEISGITPKENCSYYALINSDNSKPDISGDISDKKILLTFDNNTNIFKSLNVDSYVEFNKDIYVSIVEKGETSSNVIEYGISVKRFEEPKYADAFYATFMSSDLDQIVTNFTHASENNRKIQIKVGKITDKSILQKIKNQDSSGFSNLLDYAKSSVAVYNQILDANQNSSSISYNAGNGQTTGNAVIDLKGLENGEYYYVYVKTDDENGKYISNEAVTLGRADIFLNNAWSIQFYGSSSFKWADFGNIDTSTEKKDTTTVTQKQLPYTGSTMIIFASILVVLVSGVIAYKKYRKYNF